MNYLYIFILCFVILAVSYYTQYKYESIISENFSNNNNIILLGDSILKNNNYVKNGLSIEDILREKKGENLYCLAANNSTIVDIYSQLDNIPVKINNDKTTIFISSGGNDILSQYVDRESDISNTHILNVIFIAYKKLVKGIQTKMNKSKIVLIDIYYPTSNQFTQFHPIVKEWNNLIENYASKNSFGLLQISKSVTSSDDFTLSIEPSEKGGEKIAHSILNF